MIDIDIFQRRVKEELHAVTGVSVPTMQAIFTDSGLQSEDIIGASGNFPPSAIAANIVTICAEKLPKYEGYIEFIKSLSIALVQHYQVPVERIEEVLTDTGVVQSFRGAGKFPYNVDRDDRERSRKKQYENTDRALIFKAVSEAARATEAEEELDKDGAEDEMAELIAALREFSVEKQAAKGATLAAARKRVAAISAEIEDLKARIGTSTERIRELEETLAEANAAAELALQQKLQEAEERHGSDKASALEEAAQQASREKEEALRLARLEADRAQKQAVEAALASAGVDSSSALQRALEEANSKHRRALEEANAAAELISKQQQDALDELRRKMADLDDTRQRLDKAVTRVKIPVKLARELGITKDIDGNDFADKGPDDTISIPKKLDVQKLALVQQGRKDDAEAARVAAEQAAKSLGDAARRLREKEEELLRVTVSGKTVEITVGQARSLGITHDAENAEIAAGTAATDNVTVKKVEVASKLAGMIARFESMQKSLRDIASEVDNPPTPGTPGTPTNPARQARAVAAQLRAELQAALEQLQRVRDIELPEAVREAEENARKEVAGDVRGAFGVARGTSKLAGGELKRLIESKEKAAEKGIYGFIRRELGLEGDTELSSEQVQQRLAELKADGTLTLAEVQNVYKRINAALDRGDDINTPPTDEEIGEAITSKVDEAKIEAANLVRTAFTSLEVEEKDEPLQVAELEGYIQAAIDTAVKKVADEKDVVIDTLRRQLEAAQGQDKAAAIAAAVAEAEAEAEAARKATASNIRIWLGLTTGDTEITAAEVRARLDKIKSDIRTEQEQILAGYKIQIAGDVREAFNVARGNRELQPRELARLVRDSKKAAKEAAEKEVYDFIRGELGLPQNGEKLSSEDIQARLAELKEGTLLEADVKKVYARINNALGRGQIQDAPSNAHIAAAITKREKRAIIQTADLARRTLEMEELGTEFEEGELSGFVEDKVREADIEARADAEATQKRYFRDLRGQLGWGDDDSKLTVTEIMGKIASITGVDIEKAVRSATLIRLPEAVARGYGLKIGSGPGQFQPNAEGNIEIKFSDLKDHLVTEIKKEKSEKDAAAASLRGMRGDVERLSARLDQLNLDNSGLRRDKDALAREKSSAISERDRALREVENLKRQLDQLRRDLRGAKAPRFTATDVSKTGSAPGRRAGAKARTRTGADNSAGMRFADAAASMVRSRRAGSGFAGGHADSDSGRKHSGGKPRTRSMTVSTDEGQHESRSAERVITPRVARKWQTLVEDRTVDTTEGVPLKPVVRKPIKTTASSSREQGVDFRKTMEASASDKSGPYYSVAAASLGASILSMSGALYASSVVAGIFAVLFLASALVSAALGRDAQQKADSKLPTPVRGLARQHEVAAAAALEDSDKWQTLVTTRRAEKPSHSIAASAA